MIACRDDIVRAIRTLKPLSGGFQILQIGNRKMVRSVPKELDKDQSALLVLAQVRDCRCPPFHASSKAHKRNRKQDTLMQIWYGVNFIGTMRA